MNRALKGHQKLGRLIESTREALVHHFGRHFQGALPGIKPRAEALGYSVLPFHGIRTSGALVLAFSKPYICA